MVTNESTGKLNELEQDSSTLQITGNPSTPYVKKSTSRILGRLQSAKKKKKDARSNRKGELAANKAELLRGYKNVVDSSTNNTRQVKLDTSDKELLRSKNEALNLSIDILNTEIKDLQKEIKKLSKKTRSVHIHKRKQLRKDNSTAAARNTVVESIVESSKNGGKDSLRKLQNEVKDLTPAQAKVSIGNYLNQNFKISQKKLKAFEGDEELQNSILIKIKQLDLSVA